MTFHIHSILSELKTTLVTHQTVILQVSLRTWH